MNSNENGKLKFTQEEKDRFDEIKIQLDFLRVIQSEMNNIGMNRQQLAEKLGVSRSFISQIFSGSKKINLAFMKKIQDIFGKSVVISLKQVSLPNSKSAQSSWALKSRLIKQ